jgi:hypothetical protein
MTGRRSIRATRIRMPRLIPISYGGHPYPMGISPALDELPGHFDRRMFQTKRLYVCTPNTAQDRQWNFFSRIDDHVGPKEVYPSYGRATGGGAPPSSSSGSLGTIRSRPLSKSTRPLKLLQGHRFLSGRIFCFRFLSSIQIHEIDHRDRESLRHNASLEIPGVDRRQCR